MSELSSTRRILVADDDPERLKALISTGGKLELTHVVSPGSPSPVQTYATNDEAALTSGTDGS